MKKYRIVKILLPNDDNKVDKEIDNYSYDFLVKISN